MKKNTSFSELIWDEAALRRQAAGARREALSSLTRSLRRRSAGQRSSETR